MIDLKFGLPSDSLIKFEVSGQERGKKLLVLTRAIGEFHQGTGKVRVLGAGGRRARRPAYR